MLLESIEYGWYNARAWASLLWLWENIEQKRVLPFAFVLIQKPTSVLDELRFCNKCQPSIPAEISDSGTQNAPANFRTNRRYASGNHTTSRGHSARRNHVLRREFVRSFQNRNTRVNQRTRSTKFNAGIVPKLCHSVKSKCCKANLRCYQASSSRTKSSQCCEKGGKRKRKAVAQHSHPGSGGIRKWCWSIQGCMSPTWCDP